MSSNFRRKVPPRGAGGERDNAQNGSSSFATLVTSSSSSRSSIFRSGGSKRHRRSERRERDRVEGLEDEEEKGHGGRRLVGNMKPRFPGLGVIGRRLGRMGRIRRRHEPIRSVNLTAETAETFSEGCDKPEPDVAESAEVSIKEGADMQQGKEEKEKEEVVGQSEQAFDLRSSPPQILKGDQLLSMLSEPDGESHQPLEDADDYFDKEDDGDEDDDEGEDDGEDTEDGPSMQESSSSPGTICLVREILHEPVESWDSQWDDVMEQNRGVTNVDGVQKEVGPQEEQQQHEDREKAPATLRTEQDDCKLEVEEEEKLSSAPLPGDAAPNPPRPPHNRRRCSSLQILSNRFHAALPMYARVSCVAAVLAFQIILRSADGQFFLAMVRLQQSTTATVVFANASLAVSLVFFRMVKRWYQATALFFLTTLRPEESRRLWTFNVVAGFWMFILVVREECVTFATMTLLLLWFLAGPLHQVVRKRIEFLRGTEQALVIQWRRRGGAVPTPGMEDDGDKGEEEGDENCSASWFADGVTEQNSVGIFLPMSWKRFCIVRIRWTHIKAVAFGLVLFLFDIATMALTGLAAEHAKSSQWMVPFTFGFEATILAVEAVFTLGLYSLFVLDAVVSIAEESFGQLPGNAERQPPPSYQLTDYPLSELGPRRRPPRRIWYKRRLPTRRQVLLSGIHWWNDSRAMLHLLQGLVEKSIYFLLYFLFFFVADKQGKAPPAIFIKLVLSFHVLNESLQSISSYRRLVRNMEESFDSVYTAKELEEAGGSCIVCREALTTTNDEAHAPHLVSKRLPVCGHVFHRACLREWFAHGKTKCPTCMTFVDAEAAAAEAAAKKAKEERRRQEEQQKAGADNDGEPDETLMSGLAHDYPFFPGGNL